MMTVVIAITTTITPIAAPISTEQLYLQEHLAVSHTVQKSLISESTKKNLLLSDIL